MEGAGEPASGTRDAGASTTEDGEDTAASWTGKTMDFLKDLDLSPAYREKEINARSQLGGFLFLVYVPLLVLYLAFTIQPEFVPIPSCCACPIEGVTSANSFVYQARNPQCYQNKYVSMILLNILPSRF